MLALFSEGLLYGTVHTYIGQEANAVGLITNMVSSDVIFSNHRCHGHYIAFTGDVEGLMAELMGKATGICGGRGGSQHICHKNFFSNGIQGGIVPVATGIAFAEKKRDSDAVVTVFLGDGTLGQGVVYETMNIAALWKIPILFVVENNLYAQTTPISLHLSGKIIDRAKAFNIEAMELSTNDVLKIAAETKPILDFVRLNKLPYFLVLNTYRLAPHSKGDDFRSRGEIDSWKKKDPLTVLRSRLSKKSTIDTERKCSVRIEAAVEKALEAPFPDTEEFIEEGVV